MPDFFYAAVTLIRRCHFLPEAGLIPRLPLLQRRLRKLLIVPFGDPGNDDHFRDDATMHLQ